MSPFLKIALVVVCVYIAIGIFFATKWAITYDPTFTSMPNNAVTFLINVITWPL